MNDRQQPRVAVSLIVATIGRTWELERLLSSLTAQQLRSVELIIVDQNTDDRVAIMLRRWRSGLPCLHLRSPRGLSRARNLGIGFASGAIIAFPDDDCWYPNELLDQIKEWLDEHSDYDFLCCSMQDERGREVAARWPQRSLVINRGSVLRACASASLFIRKAALDEIGGFNEALGLGSASPFQSAEDSDLALRCLNNGGRGWFEKRLHVFHPYKGAQVEPGSRAFDYGMGFGHLLRVHGYPVRTLLYHVTRAFGGVVKSLVCANPASALFYAKSACGRVTGYLAPQ